MLIEWSSSQSIHLPLLTGGALIPLPKQGPLCLLEWKFVKSRHEMRHRLATYLFSPLLQFSQQPGIIHGHSRNILLLSLIFCILFWGFYMWIYFLLVLLMIQGPASRIFSYGKYFGSFFQQWYFLFFLLSCLGLQFDLFGISHLSLWVSLVIFMVFFMISLVWIMKYSFQSIFHFINSLFRQLIKGFLKKIPISNYHMYVHVCCSIMFNSLRPHGL